MGLALMGRAGTAQPHIWDRPTLNWSGPVCSRTFQPQHGADTTWNWAGSGKGAGSIPSAYTSEKENIDMTNYLRKNRKSFY